MRQTPNLPVEILVLVENRQRTTGRKRNDLVELAQGEYVTFVDDDDWVEPNYVQAIMEAIDGNPGADCLVFDVALYMDGKFAKIWKYGQEYTWLETDEYVLREPNHWMCWASRVLVRYKFPDLTLGEDFCMYRKRAVEEREDSPGAHAGRSLSLSMVTRI